MTTKQLIGIEEAAKKYQVSSRRINTWCKKQEITYSEIDHYLMLDEDSLLRCIERHTQLSLTEKELEKRKERLIKESEEEIFLLQSMKELTPVMRQIIKELAGMIQNDNRRRMFLFIALEGSFKEYCKQSCQNTYNMQDEYQRLIREIKNRTGFLKTYKDEMIHLKAALRLYEMYYGKDCLYTMNTENQMTKEEKEAIALLNTPIEDLGFEVRASRVLCEQGIQTLRDLLELTYKYGWNRLTKIRDLGSTTQNRIMKRLQELNILDDTDEDVSYLYKYLDK
mgnify:FL=1